LAVDGDQADSARAAEVGVPQFKLHDHTEGARHVLVLEGELDMASSPTLEAALQQICIGGTEAVTLDLSKLTFMDSTGLRVVLLAKELCERHGCEFLLIPGPAQIQRLFEITGVLERLPFGA
jgi:anti-sigma B factor antagonist